MRVSVKCILSYYRRDHSSTNKALRFKLNQFTSSQACAFFVGCFHVQDTLTLSGPFLGEGGRGEQAQDTRDNIRISFVRAMKGHLCMAKTIWIQGRQGKKHSGLAFLLLERTITINWTLITEMDRLGLVFFRFGSQVYKRIYS